MAMANLHFGTSPEADLLTSEAQPEALEIGDPATKLIGSDADLDAATLPENVEHIQNQDRWEAHIEHLADEIQIALQVRCIDNANDGVDIAHIALPSK